LVTGSNHEVPHYDVSLGPNISLSTLFSNTISLCSPETALHVMASAAMLAYISVCCDANINVLELFRCSLQLVKC